MSNRDPTAYKAAQYGYAVPPSHELDQVPSGHPHRPTAMNAQAGSPMDTTTYRYVQQKVHEHSLPQDDIEHSHPGGKVIASGPFYGVEENVHLLELDQRALWREVKSLKTETIDLHRDIENVKKGAWKVEVGPNMSSTTSELQQKLGELKTEMKGNANQRSQPKDGFDTTTVIAHTPPESDMGTSPTTPTSALVPPHLRKTGQAPQKSLSASSPAFVPPHMKKAEETQQNSSTVPPHRRIAKANGSIASSVNGNKANNPLITDGVIDDGLVRSMRAPLPQPMPPTPSSLAADVLADIPIYSIEDPAYTAKSRGWSPVFIRSIADQALPKNILSSIPPPTEMTTFSADFLRNTFRGVIWSPGLNYIPRSPQNPRSPPLLPSRTYYTLDATYEPYLPKSPGTHGAKLTAFFNSNPEEVYGSEAQCSFDDVPMFICTSPWAIGDARRYVYFGNYSQTRWSDKLDYDRMQEDVSAAVKQYWAEELSAVGRDKWVTEALMRHFFPKPEYEGRMLRAGDEVTMTEGEGAEVDEEKEMERVVRDVKKYVVELRDWEKEARMKVSMIKKEFILQAFERADADDPPALRLWWEYLQCTNWDRGFYDLLVTLHAKNQSYN
ncbi:hypothetical protein BCR34DRAFT_351270 [Clohesyomyces aquaticus]|uniref:DUF6697 domain-containing protein n=1 Tax=Clohesyomyces aquaticus TaxID=1231657 RepID=A0A1Y1ZJ67_9PLEO|nr:hypothetical protein BCR34DRAFT_351270 [Clohesyomyces aquaticus]